MNKKTLVTAIASLIAFVLLCINTIAGTNLEVSEDVITSIATLLAVGVMWSISHYYNQDYSMVARKMTPIMRKVKKLVKAGDLTLLDAIERLVEDWSEEDDD